MAMRRFYDEAAIYFVTSKTHHNLPYFREPIFCEIWLQELKLCKALKDFKLFAFCLNHDHFHLLLQPGKWNISQILQAFKKNVSQDINAVFSSVVAANSNSLLPVRIHIDRLIRKGQGVLSKSSYRVTPLHSFSWQKSFHDHIIRDDRDFENHLEYTTYNFLKHRLSEDWPYTSLHFPELLNFDDGP